jgi:hypothetical protein
MTRLIIVITAAEQASSNQWFKETIDPEGGENTFTSPLTSDGENITHFWCSGLFSTNQVTLIEPQFEAVYTDKTPAEVLAITNLETCAGGE